MNTESELHSMRVWVVGAALFTTLAAIVWSLHVAESNWRTACVLFLCKDLIYVTYAIRSHDRWVQRLLLFQAVLTGFNFVEDWLLVSALQVTHYDLPASHPPTLWHTPIFGVVAWPAMTMELAIAGAWLVGRLRGLGVLVSCMVGMAMIPCYDELALRLNWWRYGGARLLLHTPYFVIVAEGLLAGAIGWAALRLRAGGFRHAVRLGVIVGSYLVATTCLSYVLLR